MNVAFLSTRLAGTDGVSLETAKMAEIVRRLGHRVVYCAGERDPDGPPGKTIPELHFQHPEIHAIHDAAFCGQDCEGLDDRIHASAARLKDAIRGFLSDYDIDILVAENVLAIPMNIPLGVALTDLIASDGLRTIAHHHDFSWERERFRACEVQDTIDRCFPPLVPNIRHVVINSLARAELSKRLNVDSAIIPNVMDFAVPPLESPCRRSEVRRALGLSEDDILLLQPTRVVERKGIERSIELTRQLSGLRSPQHVCLVVSHHAGDEGQAYARRLVALAEKDGVDLRLVGNLFFAHSTCDGSVDRHFSLRDAYESADFVTYPSLVEGFGNALLEAMYYRRPILVHRYPVYIADIEPAGFDVVAIDGSITEETTQAVMRLLDRPERVADMTKRNYHLACEHFSFETMERLILSVLRDLGASR